MDGESWVRGLAGRGIGLGVTPYLHADLPLSSWHIGTKRYDQLKEPPARDSARKGDEIIGRQVFTIGSESVTCVEYWPYYLERPKHIEDSSIAFVECSGSSRLYAGIVGERSHVPTFYGMLDGITEIK